MSRIRMNFNKIYWNEYNPMQMTSRTMFAAAISVVLVSLSFGSVMAQTNPLPGHDVEIRVDSGDFFNQGVKPELVWTKVVESKGAQWVRLHFSHLVLADDQLGGTSSTLRIVSLKDGAAQILDGKTARQWHNTSAYFNGSAVRIELIAWPNGRLNRVTVDTVTAGDISAAQESICDSVDDRTLSNDPRAGRTSPGGCTAWLFNDRKHCMLTAGHCASSTDVILFNVPLSNSNGSYNFPGPEDQYVVDQTSMQFVNGGVGNDWCYFGCFANSNTGLTAFETQGDSYQLELPQPIGGGDQIRITGYGTTSSPVSPTWNGAQKTQLGPFVLFDDSHLGYRTDTTGGNSGSPVILENDGTAIGIHTHGGCSSGGGGSNSGTGANNAGFQNALNNPIGICEGGLEFGFPNGRPGFVDPEGGTTVRVAVLDNGDEPQDGTGMFHFDVGNGFQAVAMTEVSPNLYDAVFPISDCGSVVNYYFSAESVAGDLFTDPVNAPTSVYSVISADDLQTAFEDDFETNMGWVVSGDASDGQWQRGVPAGGGDRGDPPTDGDGSGNCYVTDNVAGNSDVDGGSTVLTSPIMDATLSSGQQAIISYYRWFSNDFGSAPMEDVFEIEISNNGGTSWTDLETVGPTGTEVSGGWFHKSFKISDVLPPTDQMRLRFTASDLGAGSVVEAGVDGVQIKIVTCDPAGGTVTVSPSSFDITRGVHVSGGLAELETSDDLDLSAQRSNSTVESVVEMDVKGISPSETPTDLVFTFEASVFARSTVNQTISLFNYNTGQFEEVDTRTAATFIDQTVEVTATGDLSRFVEPGTSCMRALILFQSLSNRQRFSANMDQAIWTVTY